MENQMVYAKHVKTGKVKGFPPLAWKQINGYKGENEWQQVEKPAEAEQPAKPAAAPANTGKTSKADEGNYQALIEQAKGFETDGKLSEAIDKYNAALAIKETPAIKGKVTKLTNKLQAEHADSYVTEAKEATESGDHATAEIMLNEALSITPDNEDIKALLAANKAAQEEAAKGEE